MQTVYLQCLLINWHLIIRNSSVTKMLAIRIDRNDSFIRLFLFSLARISPVSRSRRFLPDVLQDQTGEKGSNGSHSSKTIHNKCRVTGCRTGFTVAVRYRYEKLHHNEKKNGCYCFEISHRLVIEEKARNCFQDFTAIWISIGF